MHDSFDVRLQETLEDQPTSLSYGQVDLGRTPSEVPTTSALSTAQFQVDSVRSIRSNSDVIGDNKPSTPEATLAPLPKHYGPPGAGQPFLPALDRVCECIICTGVGRR